MTDKLTHQDRLELNALASHLGPPPKKDADAEEASCSAFGYLRGIKERANAIEFRFRDGNIIWFPYSWLGPCRYDPSEGLLLKFSGDLIYLVLVKGSNLDKPSNTGQMSLVSGGLQRHRITWIREMAEKEIQRIGENDATVDCIELAEFESHSDLNKWLGKHGPVFAR